MIEYEPHVVEACDPCRGAGAGHHDHYALGRLRITMGEDLGLTRDAAREIPIGELLRRWHLASREISHGRA